MNREQLKRIAEISGRLEKMRSLEARGLDRDPVLHIDELMFIACAASDIQFLLDLLQEQTQ